MPFTGDILASDLNDDFDAYTATINDQAIDGQKDSSIVLHLEGLAGSQPVYVGSIVWTQMDDQELRIMWLRSKDTNAAAISATLTVDGANARNGNARFLTDFVFRIDQTTGVSLLTPVDSRDSDEADYRDPEGTRIKLLKGVRYRLAVQNETAFVINQIEAGIQLRTVRRRR